MMPMTRRALARSATISAGAAIEYPLKTRLALPGTAALQHTRLGADAYGRFCPVHVWPVLKCPPGVLRIEGGRPHVWFAWDDPPPLSAEDEVFYLKVVIPEVIQRALGLMGGANVAR